MKVRAMIPTALIVMAVIVLVFHFNNLPPTENALIANFQAHRATYERLKLYLQEDNQLSRLSSGGIQTTTLLASQAPPMGSSERARFDEYLSLLSEVHGIGVHRTPPGLSPQFCVEMWGRGWAGDTQHISVCWLELIVGGKQVSSIDDIDWGADSSPGQRQFFYKEIEGNWYLERDG